jgi:hypothetical protein
MDQETKANDRPGNQAMKPTNCREEAAQHAQALMGTQPQTALFEGVTGLKHLPG